MYEHMVFFKFNDGLTSEKVQELLAKLHAFEGVIPGIVQLTAGLNVTEEEDKVKGYTIGLRVTFENIEASRAYLSHPTHQDFGRSLAGVVEDVIVVDYPI